MPEEKIYIKNDPLIIEGLLSKASGEKGVVICHPHSLMGGSMYNNVVEALQKVYTAENYSTLRFNFRGVGGSTGVYDEGRGEKKDIFAACEYLKKLGLTKLFFAGYSFGAWVGSKILEENKNHFAASICVSPPVNYFNFNWENLSNKINLFICGDCDQFCKIDTLIQKAQKINSPVEIICGADHFYRGKEKELMDILRKHIIQSRKKIIAKKSLILRKNSDKKLQRKKAAIF
ncbi:MAG: prolyl oligopeptidase family serine peptidase [Smithella sp.]|jgi:alpha/beta superfamily hydrolase